MNTAKGLILLFLVTAAMACEPNKGENIGHSTPIDSTNVNGTAAATYGPDDPAYKPDSNYNNVNDTGTNAGNVHNNGNPDSKK